MSNLENKVESKETTPSQKLVSIEKLASSGAFFGNKTHKWNPWMKPYIYGVKKQVEKTGSRSSSVHVFDSNKTLKNIEMAYEFIKNATLKGEKVLFLGTKKTAKKVIEDQATRVDSFFVTERWLGGTFTNFKTIEKSINKLKYLTALERTGEIAKYVKKEQIQLIKERDKLKRMFGGIKDMRRLPKVMVIIDPDLELNAVKEARKLGIKVIGLLTTSNNPDNADMIIPANNENSKSIGLIVTLLADAIAEARGEAIQFAYKPDTEISLDAFYIPKVEKKFTPRNGKFMGSRKFDGNKRFERKPREDKPADVAVESSSSTEE